MILLIAIVLILVTSFFCSISEAAILSVSRARIEGLARQSPRARIVGRMKDRLDQPIAAILVLNTVANTGGAALAGREYQRIFEGANMVLFTVALTIAVLLLSELLPKTLGVRYSEQASLLLARPIQVLSQFARPVTWVVERLTRVMGASGRSAAVSPEDLRAMARLALSSKTLGREEHMIIEAASRLPRVKVSQIMIHAQDIVFLTLTDDDETSLLKARRSMHSRLLLCRHDLRDVLGFLNVKEVLWRLVHEPEDLKEEGLKRILGEAVREPLLVSSGLDVSQLLQLFSMRHEHVALVRDDDNVVVGMVTLEDVIEELIGEVDDEYDQSPKHLERLEQGLWRFGGGTLWSEVASALQLRTSSEFAEDLDLDGRFDLNDLAADRLRGKLRTGGVFSIGRWCFKVTRMRRGKVLHVEAKLLGQSHPAPASVDSTA